MLTCQSCMRRCLQTLIGDSALVSTVPRTVFTTNRSRNYTSTARPERDPDLIEPPEKTTHVSKPEFKIRNGADSTSFNRQKWLESRGVTPLHKRKEELADDPLVRKQLKYLKDPLKLAEHVRTTLREDDFESALAIVRAASKDTQCVVSWNHLIDWQLSKGKMNGAMKTYNEMKKRAQTPDAYTYTIIFRGCAEHPLPKQALAKVISIYNAMLSDKSTVKPNTIHMNAVLKMCAKATDMDALFSIAAQFPGKGARAPNNLTFTIILNAIRMHAFESLRGGLTEVQKRKVRQKANMDARLIWEDVTSRWRQGNIMVDEELVCTMGRILLLGEDQDVDDVLSLIEQTMNIPRQAPSLEIRRGKAGRSQQREIEAGAEQSTVHSSSINAPSTTNEEINVAVVNPFKAPALAKKGTYFYAKPGQNTLSLLMSALLDLQLKDAGTKYWDIISTDHSVKPDADNYHGYLRILRIARASTEAVKLLLTMPRSYMEIKPFRISMSTCLRDKNNRHAFSNAGKILDLMQQCLSTPDIQVLNTYLEVAFSCYASPNKPSSPGEHEISKYEQGRQILRALERINVSYVNLRSLLAYGDPTKPTATALEKAALTDSVMLLTRKLISAHDMLMNKALVERHMYMDLTKARSKLAAFVTRFRDHKESFVRPAIPDVMAKETRYNKHLSRVTNPPLQRKMERAKKDGPEAYEVFLGEFKAGVADHVDGVEKRERHGNFSERFTEEERQATEAAVAST